MSIQDLRVRAREKGFFISPKANKVDNMLAKQIYESLVPKKTVTSQEEGQPKRIKLPTFIKVRDFAQLLQVPVTEAIKALIKSGVMATINEEIDFETASIVASDFGFEVEEEADQNVKEFGLGFLQQVLKAEKEESLRSRPPIVTIMGHVDHGKTTLLDTLRKTRVAEGESGGITQHIGAYQIKKNGKLITFLDTPGHEAFSEMRARGANVTDLIVLVVAADDGVRPQTLEVINRAKFSGTPMLVAINKVDKPEANVMRVKQELASAGVLTEEWGGTTVACEISAKQNIGLDNLLEMILLTAELENLRANPVGKTVAR
jgi:translation initiation factor IF-2